MERHIDTISVFGVNPHTNEEKDLGTRLDRLEQILLRFGVSRVIFLGGEKWEDNGTQMSEAEFIARAAQDHLGETLPVQIVLLPFGLETIGQTHTLIEYIQQNNIRPENLGVISSWHQLLRCSIVFITEGIRLPTMIPIFKYDMRHEFKLFTYDLMICALAGIGYTFIAQIFTKWDIWKDGGPFLHVIRNERLRRNRFSWFNASHGESGTDTEY